MTEFLSSTEGVPMINVDVEEAEEEAEAPAANDEAETTAVNKQMKFGETVRIRKEASVESDRISTGYEGDSVKVLENRNDGWSKIEYKNVTGYCKTEYLTEAE